MGGRHVQGLEVVPVVLGFRPLLHWQLAQRSVEQGEETLLPEQLLLVAPQLLQSIGRVARNLRRGLMLQLVLQFFESHAPTSSSKDLEGSVNRNVEPSPGADV